MDITQIRYFLKTAELLNYSRAAEQLFIARQSLRQSIAALEKELGLPLFSNEHNRLSLTQYGAYLAVSGAEAVQAFDNMLAGFERFANRQTQLRGLFPCGEGAGYAGGIMSAAVDGILSAEALMESLEVCV